jgi:hypothetical protein
MYLIHSYIISPIDTIALTYLSNVYIINCISIFSVFLITFLSVLL